CLHSLFEARKIRSEADIVLRVSRYRSGRARAGRIDAVDRRRPWWQRVRMGDEAGRALTAVESAAQRLLRRPGAIARKAGVCDRRLRSDFAFDRMRACDPRGC